MHNIRIPGTLYRESPDRSFDSVYQRPSNSSECRYQRGSRASAGAVCIHEVRG